MNKGFDKTGYCLGMGAHSIGSMKSPFRFRRASNLFAPSRRDLSRLDLEMVYPDEMAVILQHRKEEQAIRERQLNSGATRLKHIRPARAKASEVGSLARFRSGYRKNSFFGPFCEIISSRLNRLQFVGSNARITLQT